MSHTDKKALARLVAFYLGTSALTAALPAGAAVINYPNGSDNASPIILTDNSTQLHVNSGEAATQSGPISDGGNGYGLTVDSYFGTLTYTGQNTYGGTTTIVGSGTLQVGNGGTSGQLGSGAVVVQSNGTLAFDRSDTVTISNTVSGAGGVRQLGTGTLIITGALANTAINTTFGTMQIGNGGTTGSVSADVSVNLAGTLIFNRSDTYAYDGIISGLGKVIQAGTGTLVVKNVNFAQSLTINAGTVQFGANGTIGPSASAIIINGGTLDLNGQSKTVGPLSGTGGTIIGNQGFLTTNSNANTTLAASIVGADQLTKTGFGTLTLTGNNSFFSNPGILISAGAIQIGNGGTSGSVTGNITDNASLIFNRSDMATFAGRIDGNGTITQAGSGTTVLTGFSNNFAGTTTISAGTLQIADGTTGPYLSGNFVNNSNLAFNMGGTSAVAGVISGSGMVTQVGGTTTLTAANTYSGGTIVNGGTLQLGTGGSLLATGALTVNGGTYSLNGKNQTFGALSGSGGVIALTNATLTTNSAADTVLASQFTSIVNAGSLIKTGTGKLTLTGDSIIGAGTTIAAGTVQIGNGGTTGTLVSNIADNGALIFNRSNATLFSNVISGTGMVAQSGSGTTTLSGVNTYVGATVVNAGTLNVTGKIAGSGVSVASGGTLSGTGTVSSATIASGGTLAAGSGGTPGTLTIGGNLALASGASFVDFITPTATGLVSASGTAVINGSATANFASGSYAIGRFTLMTATGGLSGTFASLNTPGLSLAFKARLSYDASNVYLNLDPNTLAPLLSNPTGNQSNVAKGIDNAILAGAIPSSGFQALYNLSGAALNNALDQLAGPIGPNIVNSAGQSFQSFLSLTGQGGDGGSNFAPGNAYGFAGALHRAQLGAGETRVWGAAYGGHVGLSADAVSGAASLSGTNAGMVGGVDMQMQDGLLLGATLGWGSQDFRSGNGTGTSDDVAVGIYGRHDNGPLYVSAALGYGWHHIKTLRTVTVSGTDVLQGTQDATDFGGRLETGWRLSMDKTYAVTPFAAVMAESLESPSYAETAVSGASTFALSVARHTDALGRVEVGARLGRDFALAAGTLAANLQAAWAHQLNDVPLVQASFLGLSGANFTVGGVRPAPDAALLGAGLEMREQSGLFFGVRGETLLGRGTSTIEGMGDLGWRW